MMHGGFDTMNKPISERALSTVRQPELLPASFPVGKAWFVVSVLSRNELGVMHDLQLLGFATYCPMLTPRQKPRRGRRLIKKTPLLPGYLFAAFDRQADDWGMIEHTDGVIEILKNELMPSRVREWDIQRLKQMEDAGVFDLSKPGSSFAEGQSVEVMEGPFAREIAQIRSASAKDRVKIILRGLKIEIDPAFLRKL